MGDLRQVRRPVERRRGHGFEQTREQIRRRAREHRAKTSAGHELDAARRSSGRPRGHLDIDALHELAKPGIEAIPRLRECDLDLREDASGVAAEHDDAVAHQHGFLDVVRDEHDRADRHPPLCPQLEKVRAQRLGRQHVERRERLVHQHDVRMHDESARKPHALPHATRELARIGRLEAVEPDHVDRRERALPDLRLGHSLCLESERHVLEHREPREDGEALEYHRNAPRGTCHRLTEVAHVPGRRGGEPGDQPQQRRLAGPRAP